MNSAPSLARPAPATQGERRKMSRHSRDPPLSEESPFDTFGFTRRRSTVLGHCAARLTRIEAFREKAILRIAAAPPSTSMEEHKRRFRSQLTIYAVRLMLRHGCSDREEPNQGFFVRVPTFASHSSRRQHFVLEHDEPATGCGDLHPGTSHEDSKKISATTRREHNPRPAAAVEG